MIKYILAILVIFLGYFYIVSTKKDLGDTPINIQKPNDGHNHSDQDHFAPPESLPGVEERFDLNRFTKAFSGDWEVDNIEPGLIQLSGGKIPLKVNMDGAVLELARKVVAQFGISPRQVSPQVDRSTDDKVLTTYQHHDGMVVHGGTMSMFINKSGDEVSTLKVGFKKIDNLDLSQEITPEQAKQKLIKTTNGKILNRGETLISVSNGKGIVVYRFEVKEGSKKYEYLLSALNGRLVTRSAKLEEKE